MRLTQYPQNQAVADDAIALTGNPARALAGSFNLRILILLVAHVLLAFVLDFSPYISAAYAALLLVIAVRAALLGRTATVIVMLAYVSAAEVLIRMTHAVIFWEFAKYSLALVAGLALLVEWRRRETAGRERTILPLILILVLIPGAIYTVLQEGLTGAREALSFNLAGLVALAILSLYFWARPIDRAVAQRLLLAIMAPIVSITTLAMHTTLTSVVQFDLMSNFRTSGGYGPNQVSSMLGLGVLAGAMLLVLMPKARGARLVVLAFSLAMFAQALLTFSRGGVYSLGLAILVYGLQTLRTPGARGRLVLVTALASLTLVFVIYPMLENYTSGLLSARFSDLETTGRVEFALADVEAFASNPIVGVGAGQSAQFHLLNKGEQVTSHTEYTRLLAEHGIFGLVGLLALLAMLAIGYKRNSPGLNRAMSAAFAVWAGTVMLHSATRLAAISVAFALALVSWQLEVRQEQEAEDHKPVPRRLGAIGAPRV